MVFGARTVGARTLKTSDGGSPDLRAALDTQLRRLRSWEDQADRSTTAVVYREMLVAATATVLAGGRDVRGWGEYGACADPRKRRKTATA